MAEFDRAEIANYSDRLAELADAVRSAANEDVNAYFVTYPDSTEGRYAEEFDQNLNPGVEFTASSAHAFFRYTLYRQDVEGLLTELSAFDSASLATFDQAMTELGAALSSLDTALQWDGLDTVTQALDGWQGEAASNFRSRALEVLRMRLHHQYKLIDELGRAVHCYRELIERGRGDVLGIAQSLKAKVDLNGGDLSLGNLLFVIGAVAAGVATFGASSGPTLLVWAGRISYMSGVAGKFVGIENNGTATADMTRELDGGMAEEFIPSCHSAIAEAARRGATEAELVLDGLRQDLADDGVAELTLTEPKIIGETEITSVFHPGDSLVEDGTGMVAVDRIAALKYVGTYHLPVMAQFVDSAMAPLEAVPGLVDTAVGESKVAAPYRTPLREVVDTLTVAMRDTRDFLYEAGVALADIADNYYEAESANHERMNRIFNEEMAEANVDEFPPYPGPKPAP
jgi:hypothetical protein